jgi:hypothetical protein
MKPRKRAAIGDTCASLTGASASSLLTPRASL